MSDKELTESQKEEIKKEILFIQSSETGRLYLDKKFNGKPPTESEIIKANGCGLYSFIKWLRECGKDKEMKGCIQRLTKGDNDATSTLIEEIAVLPSSFAGEAFRIKQTQSLREDLDKEYRKKKKRRFEAYKKLILKTATITDHIDVEKALIDAKRKADETPPPPYLSFTSEVLKHGVIWRDSKMRQSSKGKQNLRRFICIAYQNAKNHSDSSDNSIFVDISKILNMLDIGGKTIFTNKNIQKYIKNYSTE